MSRPTCARCGKPLRANMVSEYERQERTERRPVRGSGSTKITYEDVTATYSVKVGERLLGYGYGSDGVFCTLRCGYDYAVKIVRAGK